MTAPSTSGTTGALPSVVVLPGVYAPQHDTRLLAAAMAREDVPPGVRALDLCTGSGALAVAAARRGARVTAVDLSRRAVWNARFNALVAGRRIRVVRGDLGTGLGAERFGLVISNPPYVPAPCEVTASHGAARAWDAGTHGRSLLDRICADAPRLLSPGGLLLVVHSGLCGTDETLCRLRAAGLHAGVSERARVPFGPVLRRRREWLCARGLLEPAAVHEELVVVRARRP
ncbi:HemK2/MTQ2 family protein methyltransferase [Streptomyces sp. NPDC002490]|uniref:HemK2/MTQ2 family protein methyltransferase n=1 Tax=Streptomyces sp. NPDC002490 TaxID=3154416 RepID=UPI00331C5CA4